MLMGFTLGLALGAALLSILDLLQFGDFCGRLRGPAVLFGVPNAPASLKTDGAGHEGRSISILCDKGLGGSRQGSIRASQGKALN